MRCVRRPRLHGDEGGFQGRRIASPNPAGIPAALVGSGALESRTGRRVTHSQPCRADPSSSTAASPEQVRRALLGAVHGGGWNLSDEQPGEMRLVEYRPASSAQTAWKAKVQVRWQSSANGCDVRFDGRIAGLGPVQSRHLRGRLGALRAAFEYEASRPAPPAVGGHYCTSCGAAVAAGSVFCSNCGLALST